MRLCVRTAQPASFFSSNGWVGERVSGSCGGGRVAAPYKCTRARAQSGRTESAATSHHPRARRLTSEPLALSPVSLAPSAGAFQGCRVLYQRRRTHARTSISRRGTSLYRATWRQLVDEWGPCRSVRLYTIAVPPPPPQKLERLYTATILLLLLLLILRVRVRVRGIPCRRRQPQLQIAACSHRHVVFRLAGLPFFRRGVFHFIGRADSDADASEKRVLRFYGALRACHYYIPIVCGYRFAHSRRLLNSRRIDSAVDSVGLEQADLDVHPFIVAHRKKSSTDHCGLTTYVGRWGQRINTFVGIFPHLSVHFILSSR